MNENREFPAELVEARAKELYAERCGSSADLEREVRAVRAAWFVVARLSLRREVEACEPLVQALAAIAAPGTAGKDYTHDHQCVAKRAVTAHCARYAPAPETLSDVAREAAEALRGNAALSERLLAAVEREVKP